MALPPAAALLVPLLFLVLPLSQAAEYEFVPIEISVVNSVKDTPAENFRASVVKGGILIGAMHRLMNSNIGFTFSFTEDPNFGPYLENVNGLSGNDLDRTYWELLVQTAAGDTIRLEVGIGCYVPKRHDRIILNFNKW